MDTDDLHPRPRCSSAPSSRVSSPPATPEVESDGPLRPTVEAQKAPSQHGEEDDDEAFWRSMDDFGGESLDALTAPPPPVAPRAPAADDDEDMWDIINEMEQSTAARSAAPSAAPAPVPPTPLPIAATPATGESEPDDWDDMYV